LDIFGEQHIYLANKIFVVFKLKTGVTHLNRGGTSFLELGGTRSGWGEVGFSTDFHTKWYRVTLNVKVAVQICLRL